MTDVLRGPLAIQLGNNSDNPEPYATGPEPPLPQGQGPLRLFDPSSHAPTYIGIAAVVAGFALIIFAWAKIAALTNVALQLPYLVSAGMTGLALVMVGLVIVNIAAKRRDGAERSRQMQQLTSILDNLQHALNQPDRDTATP